VDAGLCLKLGEAAAGLHQDDQAIAESTMAIPLRAEYAEAYKNRGHATRASADLARTIELRPHYPAAYNNRVAVDLPGGGAGEQFRNSTARWSRTRASGTPT